MSPFRDELFVVPPIDFYSSPKFQYFGQYPTYSFYNYLRPGLLQRIKRRRIELALRLAEPWFHKTNAIDFGCADGILLASLSRYFKSVIGFDVEARHVKVAQELCEFFNLTNVEVIRNASKTVEECRNALGDTKFQVAFVLETLEHVGQQPNVYESRIALLRDVFTLLEDNGIVIASVPKMVGLEFAVKYFVQSVFRMNREKYTLGEWFRSSVFRDTDGIEAQWNGGHKGFNHIKLEKHMNGAFSLVRTAETATTRLYVLRKC